MSQVLQVQSAKLLAASLRDAIRQGEGAAIEFKSSFQKEVVETLTAFANTQGGAVLMGVGDAGQIVGVTQGGMAVTVFSAANVGANVGVNGGVTGGVNLDQGLLLQLIQSKPGLKTTELIAQTNKPQRTIERWLKQLKTQGLIEFRGAPKTGGYYCKNT